MAATGNSWVGVGLTALLLVILVLPSKGAPWLDLGNQRNLMAEPHIINGNKTTIEEVPYQISLELFLMHTCGGVIISDTWVLTAAHCVQEGVSGPLWAKRIRVGSSTQFPIFGWGGTIHYIEYATFHSKFNLEAIDYDIGVLKVAKKFDFNPRVKPIAVPSGKEDEYIDYKQTAVASGWGISKVGNWFASLDLNRVTLPLVRRDECLRRFEGAPWPPGYKPTITDRNICAAGDGKGGVCGGDSGGPLVQKGYVIGLASWVFQCNHPRYPSVFTNLLSQPIREFIRIHTKI